MIKSIPLSAALVELLEYKLVWPFAASGEYTVRSGYNFLAKENLTNLASGYSLQDSGIWKLIWGLWFPNKVKNFTWRSREDAVPVKKNLKKRQILQDETCDHCKQAVETVLYAIWECSKLSPIWDSMPDFSFRQTHSFRDIKDLTSTCQRRKEKPGFDGSHIVNCLASQESNQS